MTESLMMSLTNSGFILMLVLDKILPNELMLTTHCIVLPPALTVVVKFEMGTNLPTIFGHVILLYYCSHLHLSIFFKMKVHFHNHHNLWIAS